MSRTVALVALAARAVAGDASPAPTPLVTPSIAPAPVTQASPTIRRTQHPRTARTREKEAEGSQAPNRFEADSVIKSRYQLDGEPLEVDPD